MGKRTEILGKKMKILEYGRWEEYQVIGNLIHPWSKVDYTAGMNFISAGIAGKDKVRNMTGS